MAFEDRLSSLRKEKKLTQQDMAAKLEIARTTYASYEQGHRQPDFETLKKIAGLFEVSIDYLLTGNTSNSSPDEMWEEFLDPHKRIFFKDLLDAPEEKIEELIKFWEIIRDRDKNK
ncbi:helix-turn-helix domain-containing protein [Cytobacillus oceanisediminis]|uniref:Transcriptional regulator n=1 Tax=Cytobacillus oceanisediminis TaxID=665099 RepID=A0ABX3CJY9_9BACI|nr:helix-turn-helix transcriptional regulator [Cytobacillus oceanisediminis]OHX39200.1 transcriptional regulator [Cytobacillus oceanisediminis]